ncbi:lipase member H-B-like [Phymastichus coffea]|uniref:lipase member H-B-like n=1 Tax=Phymastichus coffea TaxID=108790 RepID=UPI00273C9930|nr:lipase member H-B-like [Phymastichus coffea]
MCTRKLTICLYFYTFVVLYSICVKGLLFNLSSMNFSAGISGSAERIPNAMQELKMMYYNGSSNATSSYNYTFEQSRELMKYMNISKPSVLYIHGYEEHPLNESIQTVVSAYLQRGSDNIIVLDWSSFAFGNYISVATRTKDIARYTSDTILDLVKAGMKNDSLHVVGHSLGAHIAGFMGQYLNFTISRVTGLDPANPLFYQFNTDHINEKSGQLVDIIHTDGGFYGAYPPTGSLDFFANGGSRPQPGCQLFGVPLSPRGLCSHWRSWRFYAESVVNNTAFPAVRCNSYKSFRLGGCSNNEIVYFGYAMTKNVSSGNYYFLTNDKYPFGRGLDGVRRN